MRAAFGFSRMERSVAWRALCSGKVLSVVHQK